MSESTLSVTKSELMRYCGRELGYGRDTSRWDERQATDAEDVLASALRQFYGPPVLPGEAVAHRWSFLRPIFTISTETGVGDYDLPDDFGGIDGRLFYGNELVGNGPMVRVGEQWILNCRQGNDGITGYPTHYAVSSGHSSGDEPQRFTLMLEPIPDATYLLTGQYRVNPFQITDLKPYPLGGQPHAETLVASVIAAAHKFLRDEYQGGAYAEFIDRLRSSVTHDRQESHRNLGYAYDTRSQSMPYTQSRALLVTYEGDTPS